MKKLEHGFASAFHARLLLGGHGKNTLGLSALPWTDAKKNAVIQKGQPSPPDLAYRRIISIAF